MVFKGVRVESVQVFESVREFESREDMRVCLMLSISCEFIP